MVEKRRGHPHGHTCEYKQISVKVHQSTYDKIKKRVDMNIRDLSNISAVVETACINYLEEEIRCYKCGNRISMDFNICPYCTEPILVDMHRDRKYCDDEYRKHHPEYSETDRHVFIFHLNIEEMRKVLGGDYNFIPRDMEKRDKKDVQMRREMNICLIKNAEMMRIKNRCKLIKKVNID